MKTLKLEVGKTYRSRYGDDIKIVEKGVGRHPYKGSDGEWYAKNGRFNVFVGEVSHDLIEEVPETRHTFDIPDGVKRVTVEQVGNRIIVEMVPEKEPKPGDVMVNEHGSVYVFKAAENNNSHTHYAWMAKPGQLFIDYGCCAPGRPATPEEAQPLFDALKKAGKRWNAEAMQVEDVTERERIMDFVQSYVNNVTWSHEQLCDLVESYIKHKEGEQ